MNDDGIPRSTDETTKRIAAALRRLPKRPRDVFLLHRLEGLDYAEIARRLGIGADEVERHVASALLHIADEMDRGPRSWWRRWRQRFAKLSRAR